MTVPESRVRDHFAARFNGRTEVRLDFGRVDVILPEYAVEVEPFPSWRHGARQALAYAQETGLRPALALYAPREWIEPDELRKAWKASAGLIRLYVLDLGTWHVIDSSARCDRDFRAPQVLRVTPRRPPLPRDKRTPEELRRVAAEAMDRAMEGVPA